MGVLRYLVKWPILVAPVALITGILVALFLWALGLATQFRWQHPWLLYCLPVAGVCIYSLYRFYGKNAAAGTSLIIDEIHTPGAGVPPAMTPLVFTTTVITHLFGGSAGREGTAVQMGGSMAGLINKWYKLQETDRGILLMTGVAAGFGAVFGTPVAGAVFALEVSFRRPFRLGAFYPCLIASVLANIVCLSLNVHHVSYQIRPDDSDGHSFLNINFPLLLKVLVAAVCFGLASRLYVALSDGIKAAADKWIRPGWVTPVTGGIIIILLSMLVGSTDYLGLGVTNPDPEAVSIVSSFQPGGAGIFSWLLKLVFTVVTLGFGFKGGEVTPLFFIGAALGNSVAQLSGAPVDLLAGLGLIAVFAGATKTPVACIMLGAELFGTGHLFYYIPACFVAFMISGSRGVYKS